MMDFRDNMQKCHEYVNSLKEERKKIQVFQRELPLCLELVTQAIEACKKQLCNSTTTTEFFNGHSDCSEQTTSDGPILEEFIPLKTSVSHDDDDDDDVDDELESSKPNTNNNERSEKKVDWLRSVQLWNQTIDPLSIDEVHQPKKVEVVEVKRKGTGAFQPFKKENNTNKDDDNNNNNNSNNNNNDNNSNKKRKQSESTPAASACSSAQDIEVGPSGGGNGGGSDGGNDGGKKLEKDGQSQRKTRRCWSPELHRRFVHALQQLGGSHVATPKQIRELMKVDGLTNDEVKSHLQKYRLHTRRPHTNTNQQTPQFVLVSGIWVPPPKYTSMVAATTNNTNTAGVAPASGVYAPIATVGTPTTVIQTSSHSEGGDPSNSPSTSSSTHTSTGSHAH